MMDTTLFRDLAVRRGLGIERLIQVTDEGLLDPAARHREIDALLEASSVFPDAEPLVVAGALPPPGLGELGVRTMAVGRFLAQGAGPVGPGGTGEDDATESAAGAAPLSAPSARGRPRSAR